MFDVRRLSVLEEVVRRGSLTAAAAALNYTTPAVSQQITALERDIGATLVVRSPAGTRPTPAGRKLLEHAHAILDAIATAEHEVSRMGAAARTVSVAAFADPPLPEKFPNPQFRHPSEPEEFR